MVSNVLKGCLVSIVAFLLAFLMSNILNSLSVGPIMDPKWVPMQDINAYYSSNTSEYILLDVAPISLDYEVHIVGLTIRNEATKLTQSVSFLKRKEYKLDYKVIQFDNPLHRQLVQSDLNTLTIQYKRVETDDVKSLVVLPWKYKDAHFSETDFMRKPPNLKSFSFISVSERKKEIVFKQGHWTLDKSLIIPAGYSVKISSGTSLNLINESLILCYSPIFARGTVQKPIRIYSADKTGQALVVLNAQKRSSLKYVQFQ